MKKLFMLAAMMLMVLTSIFAQDVTKVTFTGERQDKSHQKLDSVLVTNLTQEWSEVVYYPDTLILLSNVGITDYESRNGKVHLYQNIPNPFHGVTNFNLTLADKEKVDLMIYDISGRKVAEYHNTLPSGEHQFRTSMDIPQTYLLSAVTKSGTTSIKMINLSNTGEQARIELISSLPLASDFVKKESVHGFKVGDEMQYVGYATQNTGVKDATVTKIQNESETITFIFPNEVYAPEVTVTTGDASNIEFNTVTLMGTFKVKNTEVKEAGFEYKKSVDTKFDKFVSMETISPFFATIKTLDPGTDYTYKAYIKTAEDSVVYGEEKTFTTNKPKETTIFTTEPTDISKRSATLHGRYELGDDNLMAIGFELKSEKDEKFDAIYSTPTCTSPFQYTYSEKLEPGTNYVYRAFAFTVEGKQLYGNEVTFTTAKAEPELPVVKTDKAETDAYRNTKALLHGAILSEGYCTMKERGFYFGTTENPQKDGKKIVVESLNNYFTYETELLEPATTYYYAAYATNEKGTSFGDIVKFETRKAGVAPDIAIVDVKPFATSAEVYCSASKPILTPEEFGEAIYEKGICYSEKENPTVADKKVADKDLEIVDFVATMDDLKENSTYYVRAYVIVFGKTAYSEQAKVTTVSLSKPEVQTISVDNIGNTTATVTSKVTTTGGSGNLTLGVRVFNEELKFDSTYTTTGALAADNTFATKVSKLQKGTKYSVQSYVKNEIGVAFGEVLNFTTTASTCGDIIKDHEGNSYPTVELGTQCWMAQNLRVKTWPDGTEIADGWGKDEAKTATIDGPAFRFELNKGKINDERVGYHYNFAAFMAGAKPSDAVPSGVRGICPEGWHIPSANEIKLLREYLLTTEYNYQVGSFKDIYNSLAMPGGFSIEPQNPCGFNLIGTGYYSFSKKTSKEENTSTQFVSCSNSTKAGYYYDVYCRPEHYNLAAWIDKSIAGADFAGMTYHEAGVVRCVQDGGTTPIDTTDNPDESTCKSTISIEGEGWDGDVIVRFEVDGKEVILTKKGIPQQEFEGKTFKLIVEDVNVNGLNNVFADYPETQITVNFGATRSFNSYDILNKIKESGNPMFSEFIVTYTCGEELKIEMK